MLTSVIISRHCHSVAHLECAKEEGLGVWGTEVPKCGPRGPGLEQNPSRWSEAEAFLLMDAF